MAMLDSFFSKGFKASKCKTMLKLTIPRIKLLRNRIEIQIRQMRRDIAKLLETGQEATARIRVEHIIREENMMAAQEILELFCELIAVRLPIIELQRECPIDLKEAISSVCFAAPRCADLPELLQVQLLFISKYGKEFVSAATELMPDCGVNRQLIELLSIRAPSSEKKLNLLKEIAEEHKVDWDPAASETELFKSHEDLLFVSGSKLPLPKEKHDETLVVTPDETHKEQSGLDMLDLPNGPMESVLRVCPPDLATAPAIPPPLPGSPELGNKVHTHENVSEESNLKAEGTSRERSDLNCEEHISNSASVVEDKQFLPFISPPLPSLYARSSEPLIEPPRSVLRTTSEIDVNLEDVLAAAQNAAESAERAAAAARSAASLAQIRISEITRKKSEQFPESSCDNPFHNQMDSKEISDIDEHNAHGNVMVEPPQDEKIIEESEDFDVTSVEQVEEEVNYDSVPYKPQRLPSIEDDTYFSYPNLFMPQNSSKESGSHSLAGNSP